MCAIYIISPHDYSLIMREFSLTLHDKVSHFKEAILNVKKRFSHGIIWFKCILSESVLQCAQGVGSNLVEKRKLKISKKSNS